MLDKTTYKKAKRNTANRMSGMLSAFGRGVANLRLVRWLSALRPVRVILGVILLIHAVVSKYVWWPAKTAFRRTRKYMGRKEIWIYGLVWIFCACTGLTIALAGQTIPYVFLSLLLGIVMLVAYVLICFRSPFTGLILWLLTSPVLKALFSFKFIEGLPVLTGDGVALLILLTVYLFDMKRDTGGQPTKMLHFCMGLFIIGELLSVINTEFPKKSAQMVIDQYFFPILIYLFARRWVTNKKALNVALVAIMVVGAYFVVLAIPEHFTGRNIFSVTGHAAYIEGELGVARAQGPAADPQEFGLVLTLAAALGIVQSVYAKLRRTRLLSLLVVAMSFVGIAYTLRRSVYVAVVVAMVTMLAASSPVRRRVATIMILIALGLGIGWQSLVESKVYSGRLATTDPVLQRIAVQATALNIVKHHPWFGTGFDSYREGNRKYLVGYKDIMPSYGAGFGSPHSGYLRILVDGGLAAFLPFCMMILMVLYVSYRAFKQARGPGLGGRDAFYAFWAFSFGVLVQASSTDSFFYDKYLIALWMFAFGALIGAHLRRPDAVESEETPDVQLPAKRKGSLAKALAMSHSLATPSDRKA